MLMFALTSCGILREYFTITDVETTPEEAVQVPEGDMPPALTTLVDGQTIPFYLGSYCWTNPASGVGLCVDKMPPMYSASDDISVSQNTVLQLQWDEPLPTSGTWILYEGNMTDGVELYRGAVVLDANGVFEWVAPHNLDGRYVLAVFMQWQMTITGDAFYTLPLAFGND
jgi:hypothetical protein